jgi:hypothetical protein
MPRSAIWDDVCIGPHWAAGADVEYPAAMPQRTTYELGIPAGCVAACITALRDAGADDIQDGPLTATGWEMRPTGPGGALRRHCTDVPDGRTVTATFPDLPLDPAYQERIVEISALAEHHGGQYHGASWYDNHTPCRAGELTERG